MIEAVSEEHLPSLLALFEAASSTCYCRYWHFEGNKNEWLDRCAHRPDENAAEMASAVRSGDPSGRGLVAVEDGVVVGWMKLTPRAAVPKLRRLPVYRNLDLGDETTTYSIGCMVVHPSSRRGGIARSLIEAAPRFAAAWGGLNVEGYPRRASTPLYDEEAWQGPERAFASAGYAVAVDQTPYPVYRKPAAT